MAGVAFGRPLGSLRGSEVRVGERETQTSGRGPSYGISGTREVQQRQGPAGKSSVPLVLGGPGAPVASPPPPAPTLHLRLTDVRLHGNVQEGSGSRASQRWPERGETETRGKSTASRGVLLGESRGPQLGLAESKLSQHRLRGSLRAFSATDSPSNPRSAFLEGQVTDSP